MMRYLRDEFAVFKRYRPLLLNLVQRDIKVKYRRSALGVVWSVLSPLLMMLVQSAVFAYIFRQDIENFPLYLISAQIMFNFFSESTQLGLESVLGGAGLLKKVYIPKYLFPLEKVMFSMVNLLFSLIALFIVIFATGAAITPYILLFPVAALILFVFNLGASLILASFTVFFRDVKHFYGILVMALTYLTPLFYSEAQLQPWMQRAIRFNPMYWYVTLSRDVLYYGQLPRAITLVITCTCAALALCVGLLIFKKTQDKFILHI